VKEQAEAILYFLRRPRKEPLGFALSVCLTGIIFIMGVLAGVATAGSLTVSEAAITVEERIGAHGEDGIYLVLTGDGEAFTVEDNLFRLQFDASDRYASLKEGGRYHVTCTGWRFQPLSWYRNIVSIEEM
jgi:hypothetical protein